MVVFFFIALRYAAVLSLVFLLSSSIFSYLFRVAVEDFHLAAAAFQSHGLFVDSAHCQYCEGLDRIELI